MHPLGLISYFARSATLSLSSPPDMDRWFKDIQAKGVLRATAASALSLARKRLDKLDPKLDPLRFWPQQKDLGILFPAAKMLLGTPSTSADNERAFSSASFTMDNHRYMIDIETFRREHRVRRFLVSGNDTHSKEGRLGRIAKLNRILDGYDDLVNRRIQGEPQ
jgi:hAT family C-terminal dimerisation region